MKDIKSFENIEMKNVVHIGWTIGNVCNFSCSYCPENLHNGKEWLKLDDAYNILDKIEEKNNRVEGRTTAITFSGGEPTLWKYFPNLLEKISKNKKISTYVVSNGSMPLRWWKNNLEKIDFLTLTYHIEYTNIEHFIELIKLCRKYKKKFQIFILMYPQYWDECIGVLKRLVEFKDVNVIPKLYRINFQDVYPYSKKQLNQLEKLKQTNTTEDDEDKNNFEIVYSNDEKEYTNVNDVLINEKNIFKGFDCNAGYDQLHIDFRGYIYRGTCKVGGCLGHISDRDPTLPEDSIVCTKYKCNCLADLLTKKYISQSK